MSTAAEHGTLPAASAADPSGVAAAGARATQPVRLLGLLLLSVALHALALFGLAQRDPPPIPPPSQAIDLAMFDVPPPPVESAKPPEPKAPVASTRMKAPSRPDPKAPPPPNEEAKQKSDEPPPLVTGLSLSSTSTAGTVAAPVGNTLHGTPQAVAQDPNAVKSYRAANYQPIYQVDSPPQVLSEIKVPYPPEAKRQGIEGKVTLALSIDSTGNVTDVKIVSGPGHGLNEAARDALKRYRFRPATKDGAAVATEIQYSYRFLLD